MKKLAFAAAVLIAAGWVALSWSDNPAQDATSNSASTCKAAQ